MVLILKTTEAVKIKCIAIDDEPLALQLIQSYIEKVFYLQCEGTFLSATRALERIKQGGIDLIFLDIHMPDVAGIDFIRGVQSPPKVIFVTAYEQFALQGFEVNAVDYLLKPVAFNRFLSAAEKAREQIGPRQGNDKFIFVKSEHNTIKIMLDSIHYIEGYKDYLKIHTDEQHPILTLTTFKAIESLLSSGFLRIHKSFIVSIDKIVSVRNGKVMVKDRHIPIGESYKEIFQRVVLDGRTSQ
jgi:two-component system, LytTR family, response regulator